MREFIRPSALAFYIGLLDLEEGKSMVKDVAGFILAHKPESITMRDLVRKVRSIRTAEKTEREEAMTVLESFGWLVPTAAPRKDSAVWNVVPEVHSMFEKKAQNEVERRAKVQALIKQAGAERATLLP